MKPGGWVHKVKSTPQSQILMDANVEFYALPWKFRFCNKVDAHGADLRLDSIMWHFNYPETLENNVVNLKLVTLQC